MSGGGGLAQGAGSVLGERVGSALHIALFLSLCVRDGARDRRNDSGACGTNTNGRA